MGRYADAFHRSLADPEGFWGEAAKDIDWYQAPTVVLDASNPPFYHWFTDGFDTADLKDAKALLNELSG